MTKRHGQIDGARERAEESGARLSSAHCHPWQDAEAPWSCERFTSFVPSSRLLQQSGLREEAKVTLARGSCLDGVPMPAESGENTSEHGQLSSAFIKCVKSPAQHRWCLCLKHEDSTEGHGNILITLLGQNSHARGSVAWTWHTQCSERGKTSMITPVQESRRSPCQGDAL